MTPVHVTGRFTVSSPAKNSNFVVISISPSCGLKTQQVQSSCWHHDEQKPKAQQANADGKALSDFRGQVGVTHFVLVISDSQYCEQRY